MRREVKIQSVSHKWVKRKYAFGMEGVPEGESDFMKVVYEFDGVSIWYLIQHLWLTTVNILGLRTSDAHWP